MDVEFPLSLGRQLEIPLIEFVRRLGHALSGRGKFVRLRIDGVSCKYRFVTPGLKSAPVGSDERLGRVGQAICRLDFLIDCFHSEDYFLTAAIENS